MILYSICKANITTPQPDEEIKRLIDQSNHVREKLLNEIYTRKIYNDQEGLRPIIKI